METAAQPAQPVTQSLNVQQVCTAPAPESNQSGPGSYRLYISFIIIIIINIKFVFIYDFLLL